MNDHKLRIDELEIKIIVNLLGQKSDQKYLKGDLIEAMRGLRI